MKIRASLLCALPLLMQACAHSAPPAPSPTSWPMYQNGLTHNAAFSSTAAAASWDRKQGAKINGGLGYDGRTIYADDFAGELVAIDPDTGLPRWRARDDGAVLMSTPIVADGMVFVGSGDNDKLWEKGGTTVWGRTQGDHWYAFRAGDGALVWSYPTVGEAMPTAAYVDGKLIFATGDNLATAIDARTATTVWQRKLPGVATMASAMVHNGVVFLATTQGKPEFNSPTRNHTLALDVATGSVKWSVPYGNADCTPTVAQGLVFMEGANDGPIGPREAIGNNEVVALDERTGALKWRYRSAIGNFTAVGSNERAIAGTYADGVLYQSIPATGVMAAFRASDGRLLWQTHTSAQVKMSPLVSLGSVYFGDTSGVLYRLDARTGVVLSATPYDRPFTTSPPVIVGQTLFVANTEYLRAIPLSKL